MKASEAAGLVTFVVILLGGLIGLWVDKYLGVLICGTALAWYVRKGMYLHGYLMQESPLSMQREADSIMALSQQWKRPDGTTVPMDERSKLLIRRRKLLRILSEMEEESSRKW